MDETLTIIAREWPNEGLIHKLRGVIGLEREISSIDRKELMRHQVNTPIMIDGRCYMGGNLGVTAMGTTLWAGRAADALMIQLQGFERMAANEPDKLAPYFRRAGTIVPINPIYKPIMHDGWIAIREERTGLVMRLH